jgi:hypothetical protein
MWTVTQNGDSDYSQCTRYTENRSLLAWQNYWTRIRALETRGFSRGVEGVVEYGRHWFCELSRGAERVRVVIQRGS